MPTPETTFPRRRYAKIIEAAKYLGVTDRTIRDMILDGRLTGYRNGPRLVRVDLNELDAKMQPFGGAADSNCQDVGDVGEVPGLDHANPTMGNRPPNPYTLDRAPRLRGQSGQCTTPGDAA